MRFLIAVVFVLPLFVQAEIKKDVKYEMVDRYCSDGSDAADKEAGDVQGAVIEFKSDGKYILYDSGTNYEAKYELADGILVISPATAPEIKVKSTIRSTQDGSFSMFSELPPDAERAKGICPTGGVLVTSFKPKGTTQE